jgi:hypothetical protein
MRACLAPRAPYTGFAPHPGTLVGKWRHQSNNQSDILARIARSALTDIRPTCDHCVSAQHTAFRHQIGTQRLMDKR